MLRQCGELIQAEDEKYSTDLAAARRLAPHLHSLPVRAGHATREPHVACALAELLARLGRRMLAEGDGEDWEDAVLWTKQVAMLAEAGDWGGAIGAFQAMRARGMAADRYACAWALHECGCAGRRREGTAVHAHALRAGLVDAHPLVSGFLAGMYAEGADVSVATTVLLRRTGAGGVAWNAVISCYVHLGLVDDALKLAGCGDVGGG